MSLVPTARPNGPRIKQVRLERGYSRSQFARMTNRHPQTIWDIENRTQRASIALIRQFATALDAEYSEFILPEDAAEGDEQGAPVPAAEAA